MRTARATIFAGLLVAASLPAGAGHGLMNSFNDVEPLPPAGVTPDTWLWQIDRLNERARLATASPAVQVDLALAFAREKLAELIEVVRKDRIDAAAAASAAYRDHIGRLLPALAAMPAPERDAATRHAALAMLEHQFLLGLDYLDLPAASRAMVRTAMTLAGAQYLAISARLPASFRAAQFFREEEVRWALEVATQADKEADKR